MKTKKFTHRKKIYYAYCAQWTGENTKEMIELLGESARIFENGTGKYIMYNDDIGIATLHIGHWIRIGENGIKKVFTTQQLNSLYEPIPG